MIGVPPVAVCFAVKEEAAPFRRLAGTPPGLRILLTGMGRQNAEKAVATALTDWRPGLLVTAGFAGALVPELSRQTVVFAQENAPSLDVALRAAGARPVRFHCAERVVSTAGEKRVLHASTGADVVEMESHFIQLLCRERGIPVATVRVILDTVDEDLVLNFNELMTNDQRIDGGKLALAILKAPAKIPALLALQRQSAAAAQRLAETLVQVLEIQALG